MCSKKKKAIDFDGKKTYLTIDLEVLETSVGDKHKPMNKFLFLHYFKHIVDSLIN